MPKLYQYAGMQFPFFAHDHKPIHLHVRYGDAIEKAILRERFFGGVNIEWKQVGQSLPIASRRKEERLIQLKREEIKQKWEDFFQHGITPPSLKLHKLQP